MSNIEKIKAEIERRKNICEGIFERESDTYYQGKAVAYGELLSYINSLPEEKPSEDLEEAAEEYAYRGIPDEIKQNVKPIADEIIKQFIAGANWQKKQMMKDAVEGTAHPEDCEIWVNLLGYGYKYNDGDKVRIIIVKED